MKSTKFNSKLLALTLLFMSMPFAIFAQSIAIKGEVRDANKEPIIGANVLVKGTTNGTITDLEGGFSLQVPANSTLVVTYVGYQKKEIPVDGRKQFNIEIGRASCRERVWQYV